MENEELTTTIKSIIANEFRQFLDDIEFRVAQAYEVSKRVPGAVGTVFAEDVSLMLHTLTGYTITNNSPSAGDIAWASLHMVYNGTDNLITNGSTALQYVWWDPAISATTLQTSNTQPTLSANAALVFVNNAGIASVAVGSTIPPAVGSNSVNAAAIISGAVGSTALASGAVTSGAIASGAVGSSALAGSAVTSAAIATGAVTSSALASGAVVAAALGTGSVTSAALGAGAVTSAALASGAVSATNLNVLQHILY